MVAAASESAVVLRSLVVGDAPCCRCVCCCCWNHRCRGGAGVNRPPGDASVVDSRAIRPPPLLLLPLPLPLPLLLRRPRRLLLLLLFPPAPS